jgi:hypothetical protein
MNRTSLVWIGMFLGSFIGGYVPSLWDAGMFSISGILFSTLGGIIGIIAGFNISKLV